MIELISNLKFNTKLLIRKKEYICKTKTWYTIKEDENARYIKCELSDDMVLVVMPDDNYICLGKVIEDLEYKKVSKDEIIYQNKSYFKTGEGNQCILNIEFGNREDVEGSCFFEDYEFEDQVISLGILTDKNNERADVLAKIIDLEEISIK